MTRVLHVITSVSQGGAQKVLADIVNAGHPEQEHHVVSLLGGEPFFPLNPGSFQSLGLARGQLAPRAAFRLRTITQSVNPDLVQGWLYHGNFAAAFVRDLAPRLVWSIHNTNLDRAGSKLNTRVIQRVSALLSRWVPDTIVYASHNARRFHESLGYVPKKGAVIENGADLVGLAQIASERAPMRAGLGVAQEDVLIGCVARYDAQKDHRTAITAFARVAAVKPEVRLVLVGEGCSPDNSELAALLQQARVADRTLLLGSRSDVPEVLAALDLLVIGSAFGEALPLVAIEAAAVGIPIVATNVGDVHAFARDATAIVPPRAPDLMAAAILSNLDRPNGADPRMDVLTNRFSLPLMLARYQALYSGRL